MKIVIIGSTSFRKEKMDIKEKLKKAGHEPIIDPWCEAIVLGKDDKLKDMVKKEPSYVKKQYDFIRWYYNAISSADAVIAVNITKNQIQNYIGSNTFLEIGYAHALGKKYFLLNKMPDQQYINDEIMAMDPIVINGDLSKIK